VKFDLETVRIVIRAKYSEILEQYWRRPVANPEHSRSNPGGNLEQL